MWNVAPKNDNSACLRFLFMPPDPYIFFILVSATVRNILMVVRRIIEQVSADCRVEEWQLC